MSDDWMFGSNGCGFGPFSKTQLQQLLLIGLLGPDDLVWQGADEHSRRAAELLPSAKQPSSSISPPGRWRASRYLLALASVGIALGVVVVSWRSSVGQRELESDAGVAKVVEPVEQPSVPETQSISDAPPSPVAAVTKPPKDTPATTTPPVASPKGQVAGVVVEGNVALASRGARLDGVVRDSDKVLDGRPDEKAGMGKGKIRQPIVLTFPQAYQLGRIRINMIPAWLKDRSKDSYYQYTVEVSSDGLSFEKVLDRTSGKHRGWQELSVPSQPVKAIKILCSYDHPHQTGLRLAEIEVYCSDP